MKGTLALVTPGMNPEHARRFLGSSPSHIPEVVHQLFLADGVPRTPLVTDLILKTIRVEDINVLGAENTAPWEIIADVWSTSKPDQFVVVIAPGQVLYDIVQHIAPEGCQSLFGFPSRFREAFISLGESGGFTIITS